MKKNMLMLATLVFLLCVGKIAKAITITVENKTGKKIDAILYYKPHLKNIIEKVAHNLEKNEKYNFKNVNVVQPKIAQTYCFIVWGEVTGKLNDKIYSTSKERLDSSDTKFTLYPPNYFESNKIYTRDITPREGKSYQKFENAIKHIRDNL